MRRKVTSLKLAIIGRGLVQADVAQEAGISESRLSRIANGRIRPRDYEVKNLARVLEVSREEIEK